MPLSTITDSHTIKHHLSDDALQLQISATSDKMTKLLHSMQSCISDIKAWVIASMPKMNDNKVELMLVTSK